MTTRTVVTRTRRADRREVKNFKFGPELSPVLAGEWQAPEFLRRYRQQAWDLYEKLPIPNTREEAWRRTDLRKMPVHKFQAAHLADQETLPEIPSELLQPLVDADHGGQIILSAQGAQVSLAPELAEKGLLKDNPWTDEFQIIHYYLWHHEGRRARQGSMMGAPDWAHWHGFFDLQQDLYKLQVIYDKRIETGVIED